MSDLSSSDLVLTAAQLRAFHAALQAAFPNLDDLRQLTGLDLDTPLGRITPDTTLGAASFALCEWAKAQGRMRDLVTAACAANPNNPTLQAFCQSIGPQLTSGATVPPSISVLMPSGAIASPPPSVLNPGSPGSPTAHPGSGALPPALPRSDPPTSAGNSGTPDSGNNRTAIIVALIGAFAVILAALIANGKPTPDPVATPTPTPGVRTATAPVQATGATAIPPTATPTAAVTLTVALAYVCGETSRALRTPATNLIRSQGVSQFLITNTNGSLLNNTVRALAIDSRGLWIGYFATSQNPKNGLGTYDNKSWADCNQPGATAGRNIRAIAIDHKRQVWLATEKDGVLLWDGIQWHSYTKQNHDLPSDEGLGITLDAQDHLWVATYDGIAKFDGTNWTIPYTAESNTSVSSNRTGAIAAASNGDLWIGHTGEGISHYEAAKDTWHYYRTDTSLLGGNDIHSIIVRPAGVDSPESIWIASLDGGVTMVAGNTWKVYRTQDGLPSNRVNQVAVDRYNRVWAATAGGVAYFDGGQWVPYDSFDTFAIAFAPPCSGCPFSDAVWTGTNDFGLFNSGLPYNSPAIAVRDIKFGLVAAHSTPLAVARAVGRPLVVAPGDLFRPEIIVAPLAPYELRADRGDFLLHVDADEALRFGGFEHMQVTALVAPGNAFTFTEHDTWFKAPSLPAGVTEQPYTSTWMVWMDNRLVQPPVVITFTVRLPQAIPTP